ncbi:hypothetical protein ACVILI_005969 [Mesorhizobium sp. USDA 4775]
MFSRFYDRSFLRVISGRKFLRVCSMAITLMGVLVFSTSALRAQEYTAQEIVDSGHKFFGATSGGLATVVEKIFASYGLPNGYLLGEEGSGALIGGLTYGEGTLYTKNAGDHKVFWQGPSLGWDFGGEGSRVMIAGLQSRRCQQPLQPLWRRRRFGLCGGGRRLQCAEEQQCAPGADPHRRRRPARRQSRLSKTDRAGNLESVLKSTRHDRNAKFSMGIVAL